ncbi:hypothetical protein [Brevibacillus laterosporus]|uniref:hypothetical protein n=1 Tax=Brevibacillus laterosporus TaxID=1465 RepID=UPI003D21924C
MYYFQPNNYFYRQLNNDNYLRQPNQVKAYPIDIPIYVKGENINKLPYKALNYHPVGARPAVYVPIAQFSKVGATVHWDEQTQIISVGTDETLEDKLIALKAWRMAYGEISKAVETPEQQNKVRFNGMVDDKFVFDGIWWNGAGGDVPKLTVGRYYSAHAGGEGMSQIYLTVINDQGGQSYFRRSRFSFEAEGIPSPEF